jgi:hypothetical protein
MAPALSVNGASREEVRQFYNAIYPASDGISIDSSANVADCDPGTNSAAFQDAVLLRINWFRAMSGIPADVSFSASENAASQAGALMISANTNLQHIEIPDTWECFSVSGTNAAAVSDLALGLNGPDAITGYMWDYGSENAQVPHRRWLIYPQTQVMATGDVPAEGKNLAANATWVEDANVHGDRPPTAFPFVAWPPPGYVPYDVVYPQWSFALSNVSLGLATVTMRSNGVPMDVVIQPFAIGYGENTLVWYPANLDPSSYRTLFPFNGADTVYSITVNTAGTNPWSLSFSYDVTVFDPEAPGTDYIPTLITGTNRPSVKENNPYSCSASGNPNLSGYQWVAAQTTNGNLTDDALHALTNFTIFPPATYLIITNAPNGSGKCFHLTHTNPVPQLLQFKEVLLPAANTSLSFKSLLGYSTTNEVARAQYSTNAGQTWVDFFTQAGTNGPGQTSFATHTFSLADCAGHLTTLRFEYDYLGGMLYAETAPNVGWCLEHIVIANATKLINFTTNATDSTDFNFVPPKVGAWILQARGIIFGKFGLDWSEPLQLSVVTNSAPAVVLLGSPSFDAEQAQIPFSLPQGAASSFSLLQASQVSGPWTTNAGATLNTLIPGTSFEFTAPFPGATTFYRVMAR